VQSHREGIFYQTSIETKTGPRFDRASVRPTFVDSAASGFTLAAGLRGRAVAATEVPRRERDATDPDAERVLFG
jgi:hypothetical protein